MDQKYLHQLTAKTIIKKPIETVWHHWNHPASIVQWNIPFPDWHCPQAINHLYVGGQFLYQMEKQDGSEGFNYTGKYDSIIPHQRIETTGDDGRKTIVEFFADPSGTLILETFEADPHTPLAIQQEFTHSVLNNFKKFVEGT